MKLEHLSPSLMFAATLAACGGDTTSLTQCTIDQVGCAQDGEPCVSSLNCPAGSICNFAGDELYVAEKPADTCVRVVCANDADCETPKKCSLERICEVPVCQNAADCAGGNVCIDGSCAPAPNASNVAACRIVTPGGAIREGAEVVLGAIGLNANGVVLPGIRFVWSSDNASVTIGMNADMRAVAIGGTMSGTAIISAKVLGNESVTCERTISFNNFANLTPAQARVVLVADDNGESVAAAEVTLIAGGQPTAQMTGADGSTVFDVPQGTNIDSITAVKDGWQYVSVISPPRDVFLPLPRIADKTKAGGFRGSIDVSATRAGEVRLGIAGPSLPTNLLDFELASLLGEFIPTTIDLTAIGQSAIETELPGGVVLALQQNNFTDDSMTTNLRCQGRPPTANEIGCYVAQAPAGPRAAWTLAGRLPLAKVTNAAGKLASLFDSSGSEVDIGTILTTLLPFLRTLNHGINAGLVIEEHAKVQKSDGTIGACANPDTPNYDMVCRGDYASFESVNLKATQALAIDSAIEVPMLPRISAEAYAAGAIVISAALTEGSGLVPLGLTAGLDQVKAASGDGRIEGIEQPFGERSDKLPDGQVPLTMAPPHSGVEGSKIALVGIALDPQALAGDGGLQFSGIVRYVDRVDATANFAGASFLDFPKGTVNVAAARFEAAGAIAGAGITRVELQNGARTWLIYAPAGAGPINFPDVATARGAILGANTAALVQAVKSATSYAEVFTFGSGKNLDRAIEQIQAFVVQECLASPTASCKIE